MVRRLSKRAPVQITSRPDQPLDGEPEMSFAMFQRWLEADGTLSWAALGAEFERAGDTCRRYADKWRWHQRLKLIRAMTKDPIEAPVKPSKPATKALKPDTIQERLEAALDVAEGSFAEAEHLHRTLFAVASEAASRLTPDDVKSISELRQVVQLTGELAKAKSDLAQSINGIEELAKAVQQVRRRQS